MKPMRCCVLGEDVLATAPRVALALRQADARQSVRHDARKESTGVAGRIGSRHRAAASAIQSSSQHRQRPASTTSQRTALRLAPRCNRAISVSRLHTRSTRTAPAASEPSPNAATHRGRAARCETTADRLRHRASIRRRSSKPRQTSLRAAQAQPCRIAESRGTGSQQSGYGAVRCACRLKIASPALPAKKR